MLLSDFQESSKEDRSVLMHEHDPEGVAASVDTHAGAHEDELADVDEQSWDEQVERDWAYERYGKEMHVEGRRWHKPTREQLRVWIPFWIVILLGAVLRFWGLGDKPLHHDESLHAYYSLQLLKFNMDNWLGCFNGSLSYYCYQYDPLTHGPFQFHAIATVYKISQLLGAPDHGVNTTTVRIAAATLGTVIVGLPYFLRDRLGTLGAWLACFLLAVSPSMVYFSRFAREDIYMACFTLLTVVSVARYLRDRKGKWLIWAFVAFTLSYATKEATFLTILVDGSFLGALLVWELGARRTFTKVGTGQGIDRYLPRSMAPLAVLVYFAVLAPLGLVFFAILKTLSVYITQHQAASNQFVETLKAGTIRVVPVIGILLGGYILILLVCELRGKVPSASGNWLAKHVDSRKQPLLYTIVTMSWTHWFFGLLAGWIVFLVLFTVLFTNIGGGIVDGIWQGLYYWLQQQQVARGGQPIYYYFLLIPLYEQIGLVFGIVGIVRCLLRPTRFRLFLVYWFVGNLFIYSWAAEKMPWLMIHMTMPLMLLAAIGLEPAVKRVGAMLGSWYEQALRSKEQRAEQALLLPGKSGKWRGAGAIATIVLAFLLLLPTLQNMYQVSYVHAADGPHEMMVYVQTTTDINIVMAKIDALDQKLYGGRHLLSIGVTDDANWPFYWYLRDYSNVCYSFPSGCPNKDSAQVILVGGDNLGSIAQQYATASQSGQAAAYKFHQYHMRTWWDEGYKPPPCLPSKQNNNCAGQQTWGGVGPWLWLSYGDNPPPGAHFNPVLAAKNIWQWWWQRKAIGNTDGSYDMGLLIRSNLPVNP